MLNGCIGNFDALRNGRVYGWCRDTDSANPVTVELLLGKSILATALANQFRQDLKDAKIGDGNHAFEIDLNAIQVNTLNLDSAEFLKIRVSETDTILPVSLFYHPILKPDNSKHQRPYLAKFLTTRQRLDCHITNNLFLCQHILNDRFVDLNGHPLQIWQHKSESDSVSIELEYTSFAPLEGELALNMVFNGALIFTLTFSIVPGFFFGCREPLILFAGGIQGRPNCHAAIRAASRLNNEIHPSSSVLIALRALGDFFGIHKIAAVSAHQQVSFVTQETQSAYAQTYDQFWKTSGATSQSIIDKIYFIPTETEPKPDPSGPHRRRTLRKRRLKEKMHQDILTFLRNGWPAAGSTGPWQ